MDGFIKFKRDTKEQQSQLTPLTGVGASAGLGGGFAPHLGPHCGPDAVSAHQHVEALHHRAVCHRHIHRAVYFPSTGT